VRRFDHCLVRSVSDAKRFGALGATRISVSGNLKFDAPALPVDASKFAALAEATRGRPVVAAASTHPGEESVVVDVHGRLKVACPDLLTIIAPRHPQRGAAIAEMATLARLQPALRSRGDCPTGEVDIYIFDTLGELGLIYQLAPIVFMGGSLIRHGGQNPIEAIRFGGAILHGPHVSNFDEIYRELDRAGAAALVTDAGDLTTRISAWIKDEALREGVVEQARLYVDANGGALDLTVSALEPYFMQLRGESHSAHA
jgi:3-deoxy-D-manno-octulosonic-acid transferase